MRERVVRIGAGSAVFTLSCVRDLCQTPGPAGIEMRSVDVETWGLAQRAN